MVAILLLAFLLYYFRIISIDLGRPQVILIGLLFLILFIVLIIIGKKNIIGSEALQRVANIATILAFILTICVFIYEFMGRQETTEPPVAHVDITLTPTNTLLPVTPEPSPSPTPSPIVHSAINLSPKDVVEMYFRSLNNKEIKKAWDLFSPDFQQNGPDQSYDSFYQYWYNQINKTNIHSLEDISSNNNESIVHASTSYINSSNIETGIWVLEYHLIPANNQYGWLIDDVIVISQP